MMPSRHADASGAIDAEELDAAFKVWKHFAWLTLICTAGRLVVLHRSQFPAIIVQQVDSDCLY